ncbi:MAG TPA: hypothetical protein VGA36_07160 [Nitriliruptorales bacterium]
MTTPEELVPTSTKGLEFDEAGFTHNFSLAEDAVIDVDTHTRYDPAQMRIVHEHRAEGTTDPADESVLLALEAPDGTRGTLATTYGPAVEHGEALRLLGTAAD